MIRRNKSNEYMYTTRDKKLLNDKPFTVSTKYSGLKAMKTHHFTPQEQ
jgi:hypothetical protein